MMSKILKFLGGNLLSVLVIACVCSGVYADQQLPCVEDIEKYCKDVPPCEGHIIACLKENERRLSQECKTRVEESSRRLEQARTACARDVDKFCKEVKPGGGRIAECLRKHSAEISAECQERCGLEKEELKGTP